MHITIKQGIDNCHIVHKYEHPRYEDDRCAGLRTGHRGGEPVEECKECACITETGSGNVMSKEVDDEAN